MQTIDLPNLQQYYKVQETINQNELVILENEITKNLYLSNKFNLPIKTLSNQQIKEKGISAFLDYKQLVIKGDTAFVYYRYDIQGVGIESTYLYQNVKWTLIDSKLWEN